MQKKKIQDLVEAPLTTKNNKNQGLVEASFAKEKKLEPI